MARQGLENYVRWVLCTLFAPNSEGEPELHKQSQQFICSEAVSYTRAQQDFDEKGITFVRAHCQDAG